MKHQLFVSPKEKQVRWKKIDDQRLIAYLDNYCKLATTSFNHLTVRGENEDETLALWTTIAAGVQWVSSPQALRERFIKLVTSQSLSTRDIKLLKKLVRRKNNSQSHKNATSKSTNRDCFLSWGAIAIEFPGKTVEFIIRMAREKWNIIEKIF